MSALDGRDGHGAGHPTDEWRAVSARRSGPREPVFDIGAGEGALTAHLVRAGAVVAGSCTRDESVSSASDSWHWPMVHADAAFDPAARPPFQAVANLLYGFQGPACCGRCWHPTVRNRPISCCSEPHVNSRNARRFTLTVGLMLPRRVPATAACGFRGSCQPPPACGDWQAVNPRSPAGNHLARSGTLRLGVDHSSGATVSTETLRWKFVDGPGRLYDGLASLGFQILRRLIIDVSTIMFRG